MDSPRRISKFTRPTGRLLAFVARAEQYFHTIERALILSGGDIIDERLFAISEGAAEPRARQNDSQSPEPLNEAVAELESRLIDAALAQAQGNKSKAAALLDISERTLWYKLKKYRPDQAS